jgi:hypothetical protein
MDHTAYYRQIFQIVIVDSMVISHKKILILVFVRENTLA